MLILSKQTPYYSISPSNGIDFYLSYDGIQYAESDLYLYDLNENPFDVKYTQLSKNDKVYFSKNIKFPLLTINRLDDLPLKKVNSKFNNNKTTKLLMIIFALFCLFQKNMMFFCLTI